MDGRTGIIIAGAAILIVIIIAVVSQVAESSTSQTGTPNTIISQASCESAKGHWNECASTCRNLKPDQTCVSVCAQECECGGIAGFGCPEGFVCTDYFPNKETPDAMGICKKQ